MFPFSFHPPRTTREADRCWRRNSPRPYCADPTPRMKTRSPLAKNPPPRRPSKGITVRPMASPDHLIGIDVGGTFTDGVLVRPGAPTLQAKSLTDQRDPLAGLHACLDRLAEAAGLDRAA